jgi:hypothetical protein
MVDDGREDRMVSVAALRVAAIRARYGEPVDFFPIEGLKEFFLIVSVGPCKFRLSEDIIGFIIKATLGGAAAYFIP